MADALRSALWCCSVVTDSRAAAIKAEGTVLVPSFLRSLAHSPARAAGRPSPGGRRLRSLPGLSRGQASTSRPSLLPRLTSHQHEEAAGHFLDVERGDTVAAVCGGRAEALAGVRDLGAQPAVQDARLLHRQDAGTEKGLENFLQPYS